MVTHVRVCVCECVCTLITKAETHNYHHKYIIHSGVLQKKMSGYVEFINAFLIHCQDERTLQLQSGTKLPSSYREVPV